MKFSKILVKSSIVDALGYSRSDGILRVWLNSGRIYDYYNVPEIHYRAFLKAESKGNYYNLVIKKLFSQYHEVEKIY